MVIITRLASRADSIQSQSKGRCRGLLDKNLHATTQAEHQVEGGLLLDVVVSQGAAILQLLAGKDQALLVWGDALLVLDLGLDILDGVRGLHLEGDGLASQGLQETVQQIKLLLTKGCKA